MICRNCPWRKSSPRAGERGASVPAHDVAGVASVAQHCTDGMSLMQCHKSSDAKPRACAGFLSVVGYDSIGVRLAVMNGIVRHEDVGRKVRGLYGSMAEMVREADHMDIEEVSR